MCRSAKAETTLRRSLEIRRRLFAAGYLRTAEAAAERGGMLARAGSLDEAVAMGPYPSGA